MSYNSTMQHFFLNPESIQNGEVTFPEDLSRQIKNVLRLKAKTDAVIVLDNSGWEYLVQLTGAKGQTVTGRITGKQPGRPEPTVGLRLCYSLTRREKMEVILQKATEIGVTSMQPRSGRAAKQCQAGTALSHHAGSSRAVHAVKAADIAACAWF